ncbi:MAG: methionyl-tRNA formyltransferase [Alphaproteobacteria bacterium]
MNKALRIIFMGTPDFAAQALHALIDSNHDVIAAYSQPPRPKGRGHQVQKSAVHELAEKNNIPIYTPKSLKSEQAQEEFSALNADIAIVAAYGLLLPKTILDAPKFGCLNIHGSLLPRWRGASPIQRAIWAGDEKSGVTIMQMDEGLDTGDMIAKSEVFLDENITTPRLHDELAELGAKLTVQVLDQIVSGETPSAQKQDDASATYASLLKKSDGQIDWSQSATEIDRQIRALNPWPGVVADIQNKRFKVLKSAVSHAKPQHETQQGCVLDKVGHVVCGANTVLKIETIQPEGKKPMDFASALNGGYIKIDK